MKTLILRYTVPVEVDVPDDLPVSNADLERTGERDANDWCDGRYPHSVEDMHHAAARLAESAVLRAIDWHYSERLDRYFGRERACRMPFEIRNHLAKRCQDRLGRFRLVNGGEIEVAVTTHPITHRYAYDSHIVICRDDAKPDGSPGDYQIATRTVFEGREAAEAYAKTLSPARTPIVVPVSLSELRIGEDRGQLSYWTG